MTPLPMSCLLSIVLLVGVNEPARAAGPTSTAVVDEVGLFRPETIARADARIRSLQQDYQFAVRVESLKLPQAEQRKVAGMPPRAAGRFFAELGRERVKIADFDGLLILICIDPSYVQVTPASRSVRDRFSIYQQKELKNALLTHLQEARPLEGSADAEVAVLGIGWQARPAQGADAALLDALAQVSKVLREQSGDPNATRAIPLAIVLGGGVGLWLILTLIRRRMASRAPDVGLLAPTSPDRTPGLLASQFGTPTGHWAYDRLFFGPPDAPPLVSPLLGSDEAAHGDALPLDLLHPESEHADVAAHDETLESHDLTLQPPAPGTR